MDWRHQWEGVGKEAEWYRREVDGRKGGGTYIWKPSFQMQDKDEMGNWGSALKTWVGDRTETELRAAAVPREFERPRGGGNEQGIMDTDSVTSETGLLQSERNAVSVEGEFAFAKAAGEFLTEEVRGGHSKATMCRI